MVLKIKLMEDSIGEEEKKGILDCLRRGAYTQGKKVSEFETKFAEWNNSKYAVMVNSGSSANLLMASYIKDNNLKKGDEVLVPSVTWPTTIYPIIQNGLNPVLCEVDKSFNMDIESMRRMTTKKTKGVFLVHLLGQPANIDDIKEFCSEKKMVLMEDCCESLGAQKYGKKIGNFGEMGSFSFYFGHQMTTIEGGMIVTNDPYTADLLKSMRSHGWIRGSEREEKYTEFPDKAFVFDVLGYNLRSTDINAAIGIEQLKKVDGFIKIRRENHRYFLENINSMGLETQKVSINETTSHGLPLLFENINQKNYVMQKIKEDGIEARTLVAGNMARQPIFQKMKVKTDKLDYANKIHECGIYLPNNQFVNKDKIDYMTSSLENALKGSKTIYSYQG